MTPSGEPAEVDTATDGTLHRVRGHWQELLEPGRTGVDIALGVIALGGLGVAGSSFWPDAVRELRHR